MSETRVFVGNVPFVCTQEEFQELFKNTEGFKQANLIKRFRSNKSRGFGIVEFETEENAKNFMETKVSFKDRELRLTSYTAKSTGNENQTQTRKYKTLVFDIDKNVSEESFKNVFSGRDCECQLRTNRRGETYGVVIFNSHDEFEKALDCEFTLNEKQFKLQKSRPRIVRQQRPYGRYRNDYHSGFRAGQQVGFEDGYRRAMRALKARNNRRN